MSDQPRHESPSVRDGIARMVNGLIRRAEGGDWEALEALAYIERLAPVAMSAALDASRHHYSLATLGAVVGTSRQAVQQRTRTRGWVTFTPDVADLGPCGHSTCVGMKRCREGSLL